MTASPQTEASASGPLLKTPLHSLHIDLDGKMVPFAGYSMPVQYKKGILTEHLHVRASAGLFDVSHMGQCSLTGPDYETVAKALETLVPGAVTSLKPGQMRYSLLMKDDGGIIDDLMITRPLDLKDEGRLYLVVNAARKDVDYAYFRGNLPSNIKLETYDHLALLALQGPKAVEVMRHLCPEAIELDFMTAAKARIAGIECTVSRSGYTGEDGFEISVPADKCEEVAKRLLEDERVEPIGLGARDSLRLEAGLCLYGHDLDETISPVEADLTWAIAKLRREQGGFKGADRVLRELTTGPMRKRVGFKILGKAPAREGAEVQDLSGKVVGVLTSGGYAPSLSAPIAMGHVEAGCAEVGTRLNIIVRGKALEAEVATMPFVPQRYFRKAKG